MTKLSPRLSTDRNNHIGGYVLFSQNALNLVRQSITHRHPAPVHANTIQYGVRAGEINVFKYVWSKCCWGGYLAPRKR